MPDPDLKIRGREGGGGGGGGGGVAAVIPQFFFGPSGLSLV